MIVLVSTYIAQAMVWPVVSKPPVNTTPISAASLSSGNIVPVAGSLMRSRCAAMVLSLSATGPLLLISASRSFIIC